MATPPRHVLAIRFSSLGDVVLISGALAWLRQQSPETRISVATKAAFAPLIRGQAWVDEVWALEEEGGVAGLRRRAIRENVDRVLDLHANLRSRFLASTLFAPEYRVKGYGLNRRLRAAAWPFRSALLAPPQVANRYAQAAAAALGVQAPLSAPAPVLHPLAADLQQADVLLRAHGVEPGSLLLAVAPGAAWNTKRWPSEHYAQAIKELASASNVRIVLLGSGDEAQLCQDVLDASSLDGSHIISLAGQTPLPLLAAVLSRCKALLCNDSGPMHLASAVGCRVTAFFGPTVEAFGFRPLGVGATVLQRDLNCRPCTLHGGDVCPIGTHECLRSIAPDEAVKSILTALAA